MSTHYHDNRDPEQMYDWHESRIKALRQRVAELEKQLDTATWLLSAKDREIQQLREILKVAQ